VLVHWVGLFFPNLTQTSYLHNQTLISSFVQTTRGQHEAQKTLRPPRCLSYKSVISRQDAPFKVGKSKICLCFSDKIHSFYIILSFFNKIPHLTLRVNMWRVWEYKSIWLISGYCWYLVCSFSPSRLCGCYYSWLYRCFSLPPCSSPLISTSPVLLLAGTDGKPIRVQTADWAPIVPMTAFVSQ